MWHTLRGYRATRVLPLVAGLMLVAGGLSAYSRLDFERFRCDPLPMQTLAVAALPPSDPGGTGADDWPQWRGPNRDGLAPAAVRTTWPPEGPPVLWKKPIGRGFSAPVTAAGRTFILAEEEAADGHPPAGSPRHQEVVVCCDARTGRDLWRFAYPGGFAERFGSGPRSTPAVDDGHVYTVGGTGVLHCLRADTGEKVWRRDLREEFHGRPLQYGVAFSPLVEGDLVFTMPGGPDGNALVALDKHTGAVRWKALDDPVGYSSPVAATLAGVRQVLFFTNTELVSLAPATGQVYWRHPWETRHGFNIATPIAFGEYVFISSGYGKGCALLEVTADVSGVWRARTVYEHNRMRNHFASSVRLGEHLYGFDQTDLVCMEVRTGKCVWRQRERHFGKGSLLIAGGHLLVLGEYGRLALAEATPAGYREVASCQVSEHKCWTVPSLAGGRLYVRDEGQLLCLDLGGECTLAARR